MTITARLFTPPSIDLRAIRPSDAHPSPRCRAAKICMCATPSGSKPPRSASAPRGWHTYNSSQLAWKRSSEMLLGIFHDSFSLPTWILRQNINKTTDCILHLVPTVWSQHAIQNGNDAISRKRLCISARRCRRKPWSLTRRIVNLFVH
jgi:hypothetical protein